MSDIEAVEVLTQAKDRLFEYGWRKGAHYSKDNKAQMCLEEAILGVPGQYVACSWNPLMKRASDYVRVAIGWEPRKPGDLDLWEWNDGQMSAGPVFDLIDRAIEIAKEAPNPHSAA